MRHSLPTSLLLAWLTPSPLAAQSPFCDAVATAGPDDGDYIARVILGSLPAIDYTTGFNAGLYYHDYTLQGTGTVTRLIPGNNYFLTIQAGTFVGDDLAAWIDFDGDEELEAAEVVADQQNTSAGQSMLFSIAVPTDAKEGYQRLRVRCADGMDTPDACATFQYGETEDYTVLISDEEPCVPLFAFGNSSGDEVTLVTINGVSFPPPSGETGWWNTRFFGKDIEIGGANLVQVTTGSYANDIVSVWVDWNNDGDWDDPLEDIGNETTTTPNQVVSFPLYPPNTIIMPRHVLMRVRVSFAETSPCADEDYGEVEDYTLAIRHAGLPCLSGISAFEDFDDWALARIAYGTFEDEDATDTWPFYTYDMYSLFDGSVIRGATLPQPLQLTTRAAGTGVWVLMDINQDDDFDDADELLATVVSTALNQEHEVSLTIPASCAPGLHHFRIRSFLNSNAPSSTCEGTVFSGEVYDSHVIVEDADGPCIPETLSWTCGNDAIDGVELNTLNNQTTGAAYGVFYNDYTAQSTDLVMGTTYTLYITPTDANVTQFAAYVDHNGDGDVDDANENVVNVTAPTYDYFPTFTVPTGLLPGPRLLRVRAVEQSAGFPLAPCAPTGSGEVEDYTVNIVSNTGLEDHAAPSAHLLPSVSGHTLDLVVDQAWIGAQAEVLDAAGRNVLALRVTATTTPIALPHGARGVFLLRMHSKDSSWMTRLVR